MKKSASLPDEIRDLHADGGKMHADDGREARRKAMDYLARREYGQAELKIKLAGAGFSRDVSERAVDQLTADGLQDDRRFAENFVQSRVGQGKGPVRIRIELQQRGISTELIEAALDACGVDWRHVARDVRRKKFGAALPVNFKDKAQQMRFLQYRGFGPDEVRAAVGGDTDVE